MLSLSVNIQRYKNRQPFKGVFLTYQLSFVGKNQHRKIYSYNLELYVSDSLLRILMVNHPYDCHWLQFILFCINNLTVFALIYTGD